MGVYDEAYGDDMSKPACEPGNPVYGVCDGCSAECDVLEDGVCQNCWDDAGPDGDEPADGCLDQRDDFYEWDEDGWADVDSDSGEIEF